MGEQMQSVRLECTRPLGTLPWPDNGNGKKLEEGGKSLSNKFLLRLWPFLCIIHAKLNLGHFIWECSRPEPEMKSMSSFQKRRRRNKQRKERIKQRKKNRRRWRQLRKEKEKAQRRQHQKEQQMLLKLK